MYDSWFVITMVDLLIMRDGITCSNIAIVITKLDTDRCCISGNTHMVLPKYGVPV